MKSNKLLNKLFLGAGVMKAGTTWLYNILKDHPEIYFSPEKEIHFWADSYGDSNYLSPINRLNKVKTMLDRASNQKNINQYRQLLRWTHIYLKQEIDEEWYQKLFILNKQENRYNTDFSNVTCHMSAEGWQKAKEISQQLRVIYVLRDPIERLWSHIKFHHQYAGKEMNFDEWSKKDFKYFIQRPHVWKNCEYAKWIEVMRNNLGDDEFKLLYFEDFRADPKGQFEVVEDFLGIAHHDYPAAKIAKKVNPSKSIPMPENYVSVAKQLLKGEVQKLEKANIPIHPKWMNLR